MRSDFNECSMHPGVANMSHHEHDVAKPYQSHVHAPMTPEAPVCFATRGTMAILDSGASKTVAGSNQLPSLIRSFDPSLRNQLRRSPCSITFRFGNQGTLQSKEALAVPLGQLQLKIVIVPGGTPFLLSNTLLRALRANIDCMGQGLEESIACAASPVAIIITRFVHG
jgi:hypothetical protein